MEVVRYLKMNHSYNESTIVKIAVINSGVFPTTYILIRSLFKEIAEFIKTNFELYEKR